MIEDIYRDPVGMAMVLSFIGFCLGLFCGLAMLWRYIPKG